MNKDRLLQLAHSLDFGIPNMEFDMNYVLSRIDSRGYVHDTENIKTSECGTVGCIAGYAALLASPRITQSMWNVEQIATEWLDLSYEKSQDLFFPDLIDYNSVTAQMASSVVRKLAETGDVEWPQELVPDYVD